VRGIYAEGLIAWDHFDEGKDDVVCWALKRLVAWDANVFRASITFQDWIRDLRAAPIPTRIGRFHAGMAQVWKEVRPLIKHPVIVTRPSLGAGGHPHRAHGP
jgi:hypothetical protein